MRVLGAARHRLKTTLNCACVDRGGYTTTTAVDVRQNKEHWNLPFSSYYFNCIMRSNFRPVKVYRKSKYTYFQNEKLLSV